MIPPIEYLRWHDSPASEGRHDLATSDQHPVAGAWDVGPAVIDGRPSPPDDVRLSEQLADCYDVSESEVLITPGATGANLAAIGAAVGAASEDGVETTGHTVLIEQPTYEPLVATARLFGDTIHRFRRPPADDSVVSPDRIEGAINDETGLVVITNRHNPSGRREDSETLAAVAGVAQAVDAAVLVDEVYAPFGTEQGDGPFGGPTGAGIPGIVATGSLTKFFGMSGLRVGWLIADEPFLKRAEMVLDYLPQVARPSVELARRALHDRAAIVDRARAHNRTNSELLSAFVADHPGLKGTVHPGSTFATLTVAGVDGDAIAAAAAEHECIVVPGRFFSRPDAVRVSLGGTTEAMADALDALDAALDGL